MPAPAAGDAKPAGVIEKAKAKVKSLLKTDDAADTDVLQETDEPAAAAPAAMAAPKVAVEEAADEEAAAEEGEAEEVAAGDVAAPIVAAPAAVANPIETMPAPAAGDAKPAGMIEKTKAKVKSLLKTDDAADTDALQETDEPAAAAPAAIAAPVVAAPAITAGQKMAAEEMAVEEVVAPTATQAVVPAAAVADPTTTMPAPAAGEAEPKGVIEKAKAKVKSLLKTDESADTDVLQETDEPAAAAMAVPKVAVEEAADEEAAAEEGEAEEVAAEEAAEPAASATTQAIVPAAIDDPTETMPAPAAGEAEPKGMIEKATDKVKSLLNSDAPATPETE